MAAKEKDGGFKVTDRRLFTTEGELREDAAANQETAEFAAIGSVPKPPQPAPQQTTPPVEPAPIQPPAASPAETDSPELPASPSAAEQKAQADAYQTSSKAMDSAAEKSGYSLQDLEMTFERYLASLYMSAMMHMGMMHEQGGQPRVDIIGARQTIDSLSLVAEKTKGNLTPREEVFLQNCLYELRVAYVEVTNAIARAPQPVPATGTGKR
jgi:Domain of unknown function (DUF1844)